MLAGDFLGGVVARLIFSDTVAERVARAQEACLAVLAHLHIVGVRGKLHLLIFNYAAFGGGHNALC